MKEQFQGVDPIAYGEDHTKGGANTKSSGGPAQSETPRTSGNIMHENRETWSASAVQLGLRLAGEGDSRTTHRNAGQESAEAIVCAEQRVDREGSSPSSARMRSAVSKSGGNASLAGKSGRYGEA